MIGHQARRVHHQNGKRSISWPLKIPGQIAGEPDQDNDETVFLSVSGGVVFLFSNCFAHNLQA